MGWVCARKAGALPSSVGDTVVTPRKSPPFCLSSVQFSRSVVSDSLRPHEPQHARPPCPSPTPRVYSNSRPPSRWCHPTTLSSVVPFSSCPQSFPASGSYPVSELFTSGGQSIGVSASLSVLPMNTQDWSPLGWTGSPTQIEVSVYFSGIVTQLCQTLCELMDCRPPGFSVHVLFINFLHIPILIRIFLGKHH